MPKRMLIDATHPEETRVVVLDGQKVEEFDFEAAAKRPLKGNIYLAKVTRVEPSLQAAFVEYGGNRQGFLAFPEIHPDYYQIPVADRMALIAEQEAEARRRQEEDIESFEIASARKPASGPEERISEESEEPFEDVPIPLGEDAVSQIPDEAAAEAYEGEAADFDEARTDAIPGEEEPSEPADTASELVGDEASPAPATESREPGEPAQPLPDKRPSQRWMRRRHYKIQEVIKRRQVILVQVVKEERGTKGAALTTYLSLAGRYCVLMPNTPRGGGISRKITNAADRKRLKSAAQSLELPEGMGLIIRTAGENRTKTEIKRDYEYLLRMWDTIRELTLKSNAPACVYEEGDLVKRAIRDLYKKEVTEILVEGEDGYRNAKDFMRMLMPSHAKNVKPYKEAVPLFQRHHIEAQLDAMFSPTVPLKSGGYLVINQTEALVAIDVNSGRATREHSIEETATKTNLEAADEIGRQLRLRDLAGLIVIDFIDMEDARNDRAVEKRLNNAIKNDRARIQLGKISQFGLLEMSRQRLRAGVVAGSTIPCPHCGGQGIVRSVESTSLRVLRALEEEAQRQRAEGLVVRVASEVAIYTLNLKRRELARLEIEYDIAISFEPKADLMAGDFVIERVGQREPESRPKPVLVEVEAALPEPEIVEVEKPQAAPEEIPVEVQQPHQGEGGRRKRRRRRRGGRDRDRQPPREAPGVEGEGARVGVAVEESDKAGERPVEVHHNGQPQLSEIQPSEPQAEEGGRRHKRRRRRGRRGGRDRENLGGEPRTDNGKSSSASLPEDRFGQPDEIDTTPREEPRIPKVPAIPPRPEAAPNTASTPVWSLKAEGGEAYKPAGKREPEPAIADAPAPSQLTRKGWWKRTFSQ